MKQFFLLCALLLAGQAFAQETEEEKAYDNKQGKLHEQLLAATSSKQYAEAERVCLEMIRLLDAQSQEFQQKWGANIRPGTLYNIACYQSLQNKRKAALKSFTITCEAGYDDYRHVLLDTDLDNIRQDKAFQKLHEAMRATSDYLYILQTAPAYAANERCDTLPRFTYANPNDRELVRVREYFKLDSVAGAGDELSKIQRMLTYIHDRIRHDGSHGNPQPMSAIALAEACKDNSRGLNCRGLATVLNECYLAMGFKSRFVTCMPKIYISDCHVINAVYSATLDKWVWVDPTQNAWVMDEKGIMLSIDEVRERLRDGRPLVLNAEANWNNRTKATKEQYIENYMAKNLYCIVCSDRSEFATEVRTEGKSRPKYIALGPEGFTPGDPYTSTDYVVTDKEWFWQSPYTE